MLYVTGASGLLGRKVVERSGDLAIKIISYRDSVPDVFDSHQSSCLLHMGWSSKPGIKDEDILNRDVKTSEILFNQYLSKNPKGKIIFTSTAGDMYTDNHPCISTESNVPSPRTRYGECKLQTECILERLNCKSVVLRISNIWGGNPDSKRQNGLVDKLIRVVNTDEEVQLSVNLSSHIDLIHVDDLVTLIYKIVNNVSMEHKMFLVGGQSICIWDIIDIVSRKGYLKLKVDQRDKEPTFISIDSSKVKSAFDWEIGNYLK